MEKLIDKLTRQFDGFYGRTDFDIDSQSVSSTVKYVLMAAGDFGLTPATVLDVGCGKGHFAAAFAELSDAHVTGIDLSEKGIDAARELYRAPNLYFQARNILDDIDDQYQLIYIRGLSLLNQKHVPDNNKVRAILDHVAGMLAKPGMMVIDDWTDLSGKIKQGGYWKGWHQRTQAEIDAAFMEHLPGDCWRAKQQYYPIWNNTQLGYMIFYYHGNTNSNRGD
jgi:2-polyprenyl-3-methyl-5-hydroxy-6-metoxy-1,4-benzoquinol methylase